LASKRFRSETCPEVQLALNGRRTKAGALCVIALLIFCGARIALAQEQSSEDLAKKLQNPVASLISFPLQSNFDFRIGPSDEGWRYTLNIQPVIPISLNHDWNLIVRTIIPVIHQEDVFKGPGLIFEEDIDGVPVDVTRGPRLPGHVQDGLGDIVQSFFFSPKEPVAGWIVAAGPVLLYPSATDPLLGSEKWGAGPTGLILKQRGGWTYGILANQIWSFAGDVERRSVNATFLQPFISYTTKTKTTFGVNTESIYNWNDSQWTVPLNLSVSQLLRIGKLPVSFAVGGRYYAEGPSGAAQWGLRFAITPLFPAGGKSPAQEGPSPK
jgi:hypothetical protein